MNRVMAREVPMYMKTFIAFIYVIILSIPLTHFNKSAYATNSTVIDAQHGCVSEDSKKDSDDKDSDDKGSDDGGSDSGDAGGINEEQKKNIKKGYEHLHDKYGVSGKMVAGILGNFMHESHLNPKSVEGITGEPSEKEMKAHEKRHEDYHTGLGLGQWSYERNDMLVDFAKKKKKDWWDIGVQLDFMVTEDSASDKFKELAKDASEDIDENVDSFHDTWEAGGNEAYTNGKDPSIKDRKKYAKQIWKYMKEEGMDGKKDTDKLEKVSSSDDSKEEGESSASTDGDVKEVNSCGTEDKDDDDGGSKGNGKVGKSTKINGKSGEVKEGSWEWKDVPKKYKKHITIPKFDKKYVETSDNHFPETGNKGQCTELTWAYMNQLYKGNQPSDDGSPTDGYRVHEVYKKEGADTTNKPTVGYGFSSSAPYGGASKTPPGHTGLVAGVMDDGGFILVSYNVPPAPAPSRKPVYSYVDGMPKNAGDKFKFFSGVKGKDSFKGDKGKDKDKDKDKK